LTGAAGDNQQGYKKGARSQGKMCCSKIKNSVNRGQEDQMEDFCIIYSTIMRLMMTEKDYIVGYICFCHIPLMACWSYVEVESWCCVGGED